MPDSLTRAVRWDTVVGALLIGVLLLSFSTVDGFGNALNLSFLIGNTLPIALIALPMTMLVVSGEIDLSVASTAGLSGAVMGALWNQGLTIEVIIPICLVLGVVCGLVNGLLVTRLGLPSLAVTIGTLAAYRGIAQIVLGSDAVTDFPTQYLDFAAGRIGDTFIPQAFLPFLVLLAIAVVVLHATPFGRSVFATGASEEAARFAGIRVKRQKLILFTVTGMMASSPASSGHCTTPAPAMTTRPASNSPWSPRCCSAVSTSTEARARSAVRSRESSCSAHCRT